MIRTNLCQNLVVFFCLSRGAAAVCALWWVGGWRSLLGGWSERGAGRERTNCLQEHCRREGRGGE